MSEKPQKILEALKRIDTPTLLKKFEENVEKYIKTYAGCGKVDFLWDENPGGPMKYLDDDVVYRKDFHVDTIICDDKEYELEAEYEFYDVDYVFIVHSFKPLSVREKKTE